MSRLAINYASRLAVRYLLSITAAVAILIPLGGEALIGAQNYFTTQNIIALGGAGRRRNDRGRGGRRAEHRADAALVHSRPRTG